DIAKCRSVGAHVVFTPNVDEMYADNSRTTVTVSELTAQLCGASRPVHFQGVTTVVTKLFNIVQPDVAIFGEKDYQQLAVIRQMVRDLDVPVEIVGVPTVREADGLAMSSRNAYLSSEERRQATVLHRALRSVNSEVEQGERDVGNLDRLVRSMIDQEPNARLDYLAFVHPDTLQAVDVISAPTRVAIAVYFGTTRLIDNILVTPGEP
ncbi:MAG: pantoate--beta-alanine ligase, partial [Myxococcota bacterium]